MSETKFLGHNLEISDQIKITIGAWAVRVIVKLPFGAYYYSHIDVINVYSGYSLPSGSLGEMKDGVFYCHVDLAWEEIMQSIRSKNCKSSTIIHEFVHALDQKDRMINGIPSFILDRDQIEEWRLIFNSKYFIEHHQINKLWKYFELSNWNEFKSGDQTCINVSEIFSIESEKYFEDAKKLKKIAPEVYEQLNCLFRQNTASLPRNITKNWFKKEFVYKFLKFWR